MRRPSVPPVSGPCLADQATHGDDHVGWELGRIQRVQTAGHVCPAASLLRHPLRLQPGGRRAHGRRMPRRAVVHSRSPSRLAPDASCAPFPQCSPPRLIHRSSLRWFRTSPCMSGPGGPISITSAHHNQGHDLLHRNPQLCSWRTRLRVLRRQAPAQQDQPAEHPDHEQVQQTH